MDGSSLSFSQFGQQSSFLKRSTYSTRYFYTTQPCKLTRPKPSHVYPMLRNLALTTHGCYSWSYSDCVHHSLEYVRVIADVWFLSQRLRFRTAWGNTGLWEVGALISLSSVSPPIALQCHSLKPLRCCSYLCLFHGPGHPLHTLASARRAVIIHL